MTIVSSGRLPKKIQKERDKPTAPNLLITDRVHKQATYKGKAQSCWK
jgi:hypothetical protein